MIKLHPASSACHVSCVNTSPSRWSCKHLLYHCEISHCIKYDKRNFQKAYYWHSHCCSQKIHIVARWIDVDTTELWLISGRYLFQNLFLINQPKALLSITKSTTNKATRSWTAAVLTNLLQFLQFIKILQFLTTCLQKISDASKVHDACSCQTFHAL